MTTLATLRARLNDEIGVATDGETAPWSTARRNAAIADGYAELWRVGVWKDAKQDLATVTDQSLYTLTAIRKLNRLELLDSSSRILEAPRGIVEPDGSGAGTYHLRLTSPISSGYTLRVRGWAPYVSTFASDAANDDLPAEHIRIPLLKAKAILYRQELSRFMRYGESQALEPGMNISMEGLLAGIAQAEREFADEARMLAAQRPRSGQTGRL
jgi:hypothetical protein